MRAQRPMGPPISSLPVAAISSCCVGRTTDSAVFCAGRSSCTLVMAAILPYAAVHARRAATAGRLWRPSSYGSTRSADGVHAAVTRPSRRRSRRHHRWLRGRRRSGHPEASRWAPDWLRRRFHRRPYPRRSLRGLRRSSPATCCRTHSGTESWRACRTGTATERTASGSATRAGPGSASGRTHRRRRRPSRSARVPGSPRPSCR